MIPIRVSRGPSNLLLAKTLPLGKCYASTESKAWWLFSAQINRRWSKLLFDTIPMKLLDQTSQSVRIEWGIDQLTFQACPFKLHHLSHSAANKRVTLNWKSWWKPHYATKMSSTPFQDHLGPWSRDVFGNFFSFLATLKSLHSTYWSAMR